MSGTSTSVCALAGGLSHPSKKINRHSIRKNFQSSYLKDILSNPLHELQSKTITKLKTQIPGFKLLMRKVMRRKFKTNLEDANAKSIKMSSSFEDQDYHKDTTDFSDDFSESNESVLDDEEFPQINTHFAGITNPEPKLAKTGSKEYSMKVVMDESRTESSVCMDKEPSIKDQGKECIIIDDEDESEDARVIAKKELYSKLEAKCLSQGECNRGPDIIFDIEIDRSQFTKITNKPIQKQTSNIALLSRDIFDEELSALSLDKVSKSNPK